MIRTMIKASRLHDVRKFLETYGYAGFRASGLVEEGDGFMDGFPKREIWMIERAGGGQVASIKIQITEESTPRFVAMAIISAIEKWIKSI